MSSYRIYYIHTKHQHSFGRISVIVLSKVFILVVLNHSQLRFQIYNPCFSF